ncbi:hypothetical protein BDZ89DRAFT_965626 [Hymenopellis radicata]|nr:hypothetical protein BDZ89DRAFT_965626 [Hymenopellis radicata]
MEALQILKFAIKMRGGLDFTQYKSLEEQLADLEALTDSEFAVPTDVGAFASSLRTTESFAVS